jgi:hypothetical protein
MSNEVLTPKNTGLGALDALRSGLSSVRTRLPEASGGPFLRLLKDGDWVFGQEDNAVAKGTEAIINPLSIKHGYSCWTNRQPGEGKNELLGELMVGLNQPLPMMHELPKHTDPQNGKPVPWKDQLSMDMKFLYGRHKGVQVTWKVSSVGGLNAARQILDAIIAKLEHETPFVCPIVTLDSDSYKHVTYGKTYVPKISVFGWADLEGNEEDDDREVPRTVTERIAAPEPEPVREMEPMEESVRRRRRV